jgi:hypothetical protein
MASEPVRELRNGEFFLAPAFWRAFRNQADARLKAGATQIETEFSSMHFSLFLTLGMV